MMALGTILLMLGVGDLMVLLISAFALATQFIAEATLFLLPRVGRYGVVLPGLLVAVVVVLITT